MPTCNSTPTGNKSTILSRKGERTNLEKVKEERAKVRRAANSSLLEHTSSSLQKIQNPKTVAGMKSRRKTEVTRPETKETKILGRISDLFQVVKSKEKNKSDVKNEFQVFLPFTPSDSHAGTPGAARIVVHRMTFSLIYPPASYFSLN